MSSCILCEGNPDSAIKSKLLKSEQLLRRFPDEDNLSLIGNLIQLREHNDIANNRDNPDSMHFQRNIWRFVFTKFAKIIRKNPPQIYLEPSEHREGKVRIRRSTINFNSFVKKKDDVINFHPLICKTCFQTKEAYEYNVKTMKQICMICFSEYED
ncbi:MAG: hypothetical protein INQ03_15790 [Candidatus Heimdallarchaeota archaeon]|nr:hypothetical protein [Candidatus Heimdallarchaeota archaeon]